MGMNLQEFMKDKILGNVRSGTRDKDDRPVKLAYFDVHEDKTTSSLAVEIFNEKYHNPKQLKIKFFNQSPLEVYLERYEGRKRRCYGNGKHAILMDDRGKKQVIECNVKECPYREEKDCKFVGKLYFLIEGLEDEGIWCYPIGSEKGIKKISARIARANRKEIDLTDEWYELFLRAEDAPTKGMNYIPDIRRVGEVETNNKPSQSEKNNNTNNKGSQTVNYLMLKQFEVTMYENKEVPKLIMIDVSSKEHELILLPTSKQDILNLEPGSIILPLTIDKNGEISILKDYKIVKNVSNETQNKRAV